MTSHSYAIAYAPQPTVTPPPLTVADLEAHNITYICVQWVDWSNQVRIRILSLAHFTRLLDTTPPGICFTNVTLATWRTHLAPGYGPVGEYFYELDLASLRLSPHCPGQASIMGWYREKTPIGKVLNHPFCPRSMLKKTVDSATSAGISYLVGFETEFILLKEVDDKWEPISTHTWCSKTALMTGSLAAVVLRDIADAIHAAGIQLDMYHPEMAPGQYEVVTGPLPPLEAADALVVTREIIYNIANKHGLRATMAPRVFHNTGRNGSHAHISVHSSDPSQNRLASPPGSTTQLTAVESSFLAGLMQNLPAVCAFTLPTPASYLRVVDGVWTGGTYVVWGSDNKEAAVRLCGPVGKHHFEIKTLDATASPYLALTAILGVGTHGIERRTALTCGDCSQKPFLDMSNTEQRRLGYDENTARIPRTLQTARKELENSELMKGLFDRAFVEEYLKVNEFVGNILQEGTEEEKLNTLIDSW